MTYSEELLDFKPLKPLRLNQSFIQWWKYNRVRDPWKPSLKYFENLSYSNSFNQATPAHLVFKLLIFGCYFFRFEA
jgi:hypothetical protein